MKIEGRNITVEVGNKFTEVDRSNLWTVTKLNKEDNTVDLINQHKCEIKHVDLETKNYHFAHMGQFQFQPFNPTCRFVLKMNGATQDEEIKTRVEAKSWAELLDSEGEQYTITDLVNNKIVFSSQLTKLTH